jgi:oligoribonuclease (3'-5' exoribonuclease)
MTKKEFEENPEPLVLIVSFNPETGKSIWETYHWLDADGFMEDFKRDFPKLIHFRTLNASGIKERKKMWRPETIDKK